MTSFVAVPATSVNVPKLVVPVMPAIALVPEFVMLPDASGVAAVGRTRMFCQVRLFRTVPELTSFTVKVSAVLVTVVKGTEVPDATLLMLLLLPPLPARRVTITVGAVPPVSKTKPAGALRTIVPVPITPVAVSLRTGPASDVNGPPTVSAEIAAPPVAGVTVATARKVAVTLWALLPIEKLQVLPTHPVIPLV
jgi:hypothetical protein